MDRSAHIRPRVASLDGQEGGHQRQLYDGNSARQRENAVGR